MTGPHLTPEREAEIQALNLGAFSRTAREAICDLLAALDAERAAHAQTRTALTDSTALLANATVVLRRSLRTDALSKELARQAQANQRVLGLAVAEADKPHDGNER